jgi:MoaA/NifB/PqqE/SkfB family radical SAM enzyme
MNSPLQRLRADGPRRAVGKLDRRKFRDPKVTESGARRARVTLHRLQTLWFNTGTLCNITCRNCYIDSSPRNDRLVYLTRSEVLAYLDEIERGRWGTDQIGFTGGEPFMNRDFLGMLEDCLARGFRVLVLIHFTAERHEEERGPGTFRPTLEGLIWLARSGFRLAVAGRTMWGEELEAERAGYAKLFAEHDIPIAADDPAELVLFPEMDPDSEARRPACDAL